jgi:uracil-DNA glycosylase family 4
VTWREQVATDKRAAYLEERYWGRPVTGFGPPRARIAIVGLAPAAHGGNRTGRIFTGDRSGDWLFASLHRVGLARKPISLSAEDGQELIGTRILATVRCAPPANKPTPEERDACRPWMVTELRFLRSTLRVVVTLGAFAWASVWPVLAELGYPPAARKGRFGHGVEVELGEGRLWVIGSYHPSQQNTFTGKVTEEMLDAVLGRAATVAGIGAVHQPSAPLPEGLEHG